jgi:Zn-dependent metalloprotease
MRMVRVVLPALLASAALAPAASAAGQQASQDRFAREARGERIVSSPATAGASTATGTVTLKQLGVSGGAGAGSVARAAVDRYASTLGVADARAQLRYAGATTDALGQRHVRFEQVAGGVPVYDGLVTVHLARGADALKGFTAGVTQSTSGAASQPSISADQARDVASAQVADARLVQAPRLVVYTGVPLGSRPATLSWAVDVSSKSRPERKLVFVDAASGRVADALDRTEFAKNRTVYDANGSTTSGSFARGEGDPATGDADVDGAYDFTGATYDYYASTFGRDSYDGAGAELVSFVHYGVGYENAFWDGFEMVYGEGFAVNDVTAHELTHAVTERTAGLEYQDQPGALNESISDQAG